LARNFPGCRFAFARLRSKRIGLAAGLQGVGPVDAVSTETHIFWHEVPQFEFPAIGSGSEPSFQLFDAKSNISPIARNFRSYIVDA
jgi:hypothetical protein